MQPARCRILYVDDHEDTSFMLTHLLGQWDYEVITAKSVADALSLVDTSKFDLYVLDKLLPDGSGLDLCRTLNKSTPDVPVIFYSGDAYELHRQEAMCAGANAYVTKPSIEELVANVHLALAQTECSTAAV